jgi:regulator of sigma E protease
MLTAIIFLIVLGILIVVHEFGHFIVAKKIGVRVEKFSLGFGPRLITKKKKDTEYSISAIPLGGYVKMAGDNLEEFQGKSDEYFAKPPGKRFWIIVFGPLLNYLLGFLLFWLIFFVGYPTLTTKVGGLIDGLGAKSAGIQVGDRIIAVDGEAVDYWEDLQKIIQSKKEATRVRLFLLRETREYAIDVFIREQKVDDALGQKRNVGLLGITASDEIKEVRHGFLKSFSLGLRKTFDLTVLTFKALGMMLTGKLSMKDSITGPLGIFYITSQAARLGAIALMHFMAVLSVSLAIFNLFPLPVLDGGHILFLVIEKARGRTLSIKTERIINQIGLTLIMSLALFVTYNDVMRFFGDKIAKIFSR